MYRQLTLDNTPNDLERGDLILAGAKQNATWFGVVYGFSKSRKTLLILVLKDYKDLTTSMLFDAPGNYCTQFKNMQVYADMPFCRKTDYSWCPYYQELVPYSPDMLPKFLYDKYLEIRKLLQVE